MGIIGVSLIPYGAQYRRAVRVSLLIPGLFLILLMTLFLLFSLSVVKEPLAEFVRKWWPLILILMGLTLVASSWFRQPETKE
jgi:pilus assembly protein TadC